ncbi:hypothetical protein FXO38_32013 [Capsicum annuum]|nr:hypothetical protein FXO38_32013 [Capsicum annuum]
MFHFDQSELNSSESNEMNSDYDFVSLDKWDFNVIPLQHQSNVDETKKISGSKLPSAFKILKEYDTIRFKRSKTDKKIITNSECIKLSVTDKKIITNSECIKLSVDEILRLGAEKFIQSCTIHGDRESYMLFASSFLGLSEDDTRNVALVENLLTSAEKVSQKQYDRARRILNECDKFYSNTGNPVHRLAYYFSQVLYDRIDRDTGRDSSKDIGMNRLVPMEHLLMNLDLSMIAAHQNIPLSQVTQFAGVQAIINHVGESKKVHIIDLDIGCGMCESSLKHLRITALCTKLRHKIEDTRERLMDFTVSLNLPFSFNIVMVEDVMKLKQEDFEIDDEEAISIFARYILMRMLAQPAKLDSLMRVIRGINPRAMIVIEVEANHNSPAFVDRFVEALFFYGAFFDSLEDWMRYDKRNRTAVESEHLSQGIRSIVATEGEERTIKHVKVDVWRAFFALYGMEEMELSMSSLYQANLVLKNFPYGSCCTLEMTKNFLLIGWKGTPLISLSAWKLS